MESYKKTYCFGCSKLRRCKNTGTQRAMGIDFIIWVCQWCRAAQTRRKNK